MTESEWMACDHVGSLMVARRGWKRTTRKLRLLVCGYFRRIWHLPSDAGRSAIEVAERHADGWATNDELTTIRPDLDRKTPTNIADIGIHYAAAPNRIFRNWATTALVHAARAVAEMGPDRIAEELAQCHLARDIFGNPFRPVTLDRSWLTPTVLALARSIYDERAFNRMPMLADALEDAGCTDPTILDHLRGPGPHVRGCFALDFVLGKS
jgi:hypothetical protein